MARRRAELRELRGSIAFLVVALSEALLFGVGLQGSGGGWRLAATVLWLLVAAGSVHRLWRAWPRWRAAQGVEADRIVSGRLGQESPDLARLVTLLPTSSVREVAARLANHVMTTAGVGVGLRVRDLDREIQIAGEREADALAKGMLGEADEAFRKARALTCARLAHRAVTREDLSEVVYEALHAVGGDEVAVAELLSRSLGLTGSGTHRSTGLVPDEARRSPE